MRAKLLTLAVLTTSLALALGTVFPCPIHTY